MVDSLDVKNFLQIGANVVIVGGVAFWLNGKIRSLEDRIVELEKQNNEYAEIIKKHDQILSVILNNPIERSRPPPPRPSPSPTPPKQKQEEAPDLDEFLQDELDEVEKYRSGS